MPKTVFATHQSLAESNEPALRFGAGLTEAEVRRLRIILRDKCGADLSLPEAWSRAVELLSLVELLLQPDEVAP